MADPVQDARQSVRVVRRALISAASNIAREIHDEIDGDRPPPPVALGKLIALETQISSLNRLVREMEDIDAV